MTQSTAGPTVSRNETECDGAQLSVCQSQPAHQAGPLLLQIQLERQLQAGGLGRLKLALYEIRAPIKDTFRALKP